MTVSFFVGCWILIASWVVPKFIKNQEIKTIVGVVLSAIATGIFVGHLIDLLFN